MMDAIIHRGPNSAGQYIDDDAALGFRRLSIIDLEGGSQPLYNEDKTKVLTFNGEIYNYQSIRKELIEKGYHFKTNTDSEVLIHGYQEYGVALLQKLRGMFALLSGIQRRRNYLVHVTTLELSHSIITIRTKYLCMALKSSLSYTIHPLKRN